MARTRLALGLTLTALLLAGCSYPRLVEDGRVDEAYLQRVIERTSDARGIPLDDAPLQWTLLTDEQQRAKIRAAVAEVTTSVDASLKVMRAFGLVGREFDGAKLGEALADQVAAHYDSGTRTFHLVERESSSGFTSWLLERDVEAEFVACHEIVHALQDRRHDLEPFLQVGDADERLARKALVEGDATYFGVLAMLDGLLSQRELDDFRLEPELVEDAAGSMEGLPPALVEQLVFPYLGGFELMQALGRAGRRGVWRAPPRSTEQVLHPDKYSAGELPDAIQLAATEPPAGWSLVEEDALGELGLRTLFVGLDELTRDDALRGAAGWSGDRYRVYEGPGGALALTWAVSFDTPGDAREFVDLYRRRAAERLEAAEGSPDASSAAASLCVVHGERGVVVVEAPDGVVLKAIAPAALLHTVTAVPPAPPARGSDEGEE